MATIQIKLSDKLDKQLQYYMLDNNIKTKKIAITKILEEEFKK